MIAVANFLSRDLDPLAAGIADSWRDRGARFETGATLEDFRQGRVAAALICGLAYSLLRDTDGADIVPVAAPVVDDERSGGAAVYFSEIVAPAAGGAFTFEDLAGGVFAYNEEVSFSGYRALESALIARGLSWDFFGQRLRSGSHHDSLQWIKSGRADAAAIDSQALLLETRRDPALAGRIRVLDSLGPYPAPPLVVNRAVLDTPVDELRARLETLPGNCLRSTGVRGWHGVDDTDYDLIRRATADLPGLRL